MGYAFTRDSKYNFDESLKSRNGYYFSIGVIGKIPQRIIAGWKVNIDLLQTGLEFSANGIQSQSRSNYVFVRTSILLSSRRNTQAND